MAKAKVEKRVTLVADCSREFVTRRAVVVLSPRLVNLILRRMDKYKRMQKLDKGLAYFQFWCGEVDFFEKIPALPEDVGEEMEDAFGEWVEWETAPVEITGESAKMDAVRMVVDENSVRWEGYDHYADSPLCIETGPIGRKELEDFLAKAKEVK